MADIQKEKIIERFKFLRSKLKKSQFEMAEDTGVRQASISAYEKGVRDITAKFLLKLEEAYNVNRDWLTRGVGAMFNQSEPYYEETLHRPKEQENISVHDDFIVDEPDDSEMFDILLENMKSIFEKQAQEIKLLRAENSNLQKLVSMFKR